MALLGASAATLAIYLIPGLGVIAWPLVLISTLAHELGHGLTALLMGGDFVALFIWPDASGLALYVARFGRIRHAAAAAGGLLGPPLLAYGLFVASRRPESARRSLIVAALLLIVVLLLWARNLFGALFIGGLSLTLGLIALKGSPRIAQLTAVFLAIQLALSVFSRGDYLFTRSAETAQGTGPSDTSQIAQALFLPYWFWGGLIAVLSLWLIWHGLRAFSARLH